MRELLLDCVGSVPELDWIPTVLIHRARESAPGPHGIPYAAWKGAGSRILELIHRALCSWMHGAALPAGFNTAHGLPVRSPDKTRPLTLSNAIAKPSAKPVCFRPNRCYISSSAAEEVCQGQAHC